MKSAPTNFRHTTPQDLKMLLRHAPQIKVAWDRLTPLARNEWICYVTMVKKTETREKHLVRLKEDLLKGKKRPCCWAGCPHRRTNAAKWFKKSR